MSNPQIYIIISQKNSEKIKKPPPLTNEIKKNTNPSHRWKRRAIWTGNQRKGEWENDRAGDPELPQTDESQWHQTMGRVREKEPQDEGGNAGNYHQHEGYFGKGKGEERDPEGEEEEG